MGRDTATIKYAIGSLFGNTFNMYLFGASILTLLNFVSGLIETQTVSGAVEVAVNYYISKLTPFPINEFLTASGFEDVMGNVAIAVFLGVLVASWKYRENRF